MTRWLTTMALIAMLTLSTLPGWGQDDDYSIEFAYTLLTKRSVLERELEFKFNYEKNSDLKSFEWVAALEWVILPRWQMELEVPVVLQGPSEGPNQKGIGDLELTNRFLLNQGLTPATLVTFGLETKLRTGSERKGTGGEATLEPWLAGGIAVGPFDLQGSIAYEMALRRPDQQLETAAAVAYRLSRWFTPLLEIELTKQTREASGEPLPNAQFSILPGFNVNPLPGVTLAAGIEIPLTQSKAFDYAVRALFVWEF